MSNSKLRKKNNLSNLIGMIYSLAIYTVLYIPVLVMMIFSFNNQRYNYYWNGFTTQWYAKLFTNSTVIGSLWYSVIIAVLATLISVTIGTIGALGLRKYEFKGRKAINNMLYIPIIVPEIVMAVALLIVFMKVGFALGMGSILIGHCTFCIPYAVVTIKGRISGDDYSLEEAFINVTLPSIFPGVMSAAFLSFTLSIDDVVMSNMLSGAKNSTLPVLILSMNKSGVTPDINALTTIMILIIVIAMILNNKINNALKKRRKVEGIL